jgi:hypothetical protein
MRNDAPTAAAGRVKGRAHMKRRKRITIIEACADDALFAGWFRKRETWSAWFSFLKVLFGLPLDARELETFRQCTGRSEPPSGIIREAYLICGRRAGKSFVLALTAVYLAVFHDWSGCLNRGERGTVMVVAADRKQARVIFRYITALLKVPMLAALVERAGAERIDLRNSLSIEIMTASFRTIRGYTLVAALLDELAFWQSDAGAANPDTEILTALKPAMATVPGSMLLCASSPYAKRGVLWNAYHQHYGKDGPTLVWKAPTTTMNSTVPAATIAEAYEADPANASAEYGAEFRADVEAFVSREIVEACIVPHRHELPPMANVPYVAFCDPSGGSADSMTLAVTHRSKDGYSVLDAVRERKPPFSPEVVAAEFAGLLKSYGVHVVTGDRHGGEWLRERFAVHGIRYEIASQTSSDIYRAALPLLNDGRAELFDAPRLVAQLCGLERRVSRSGKELIGAVSNGHDDVALAVCGALLLAQAATPSLWKADAFLLAGAPVPLPRECLMLFAVVVSDQQGQCGIGYFLPQLGGPLIVLDWELKDYLTPTLLTGVAARLVELSAMLRAQAWSIYTTTGLEREFRSLGVGGVDAADAVIGDDDGLLRLAVAKHINANKIKSAKPDNYVLTGLLESREENPLKTALLTGIVLALDPGRTLTKPRAA